MYLILPKEDGVLNGDKLNVAIEEKAFVVAVGNSKYLDEDFPDKPKLVIL
jgi:hypothetical protein